MGLYSEYRSKKYKTKMPRGPLDSWTRENTPGLVSTNIDKIWRMHEKDGKIKFDGLDDVDMISVTSPKNKHQKSRYAIIFLEYKGTEQKIGYGQCKSFEEIIKYIAPDIPIFVLFGSCSFKDCPYCHHRDYSYHINEHGAYLWKYNRSIIRQYNRRVVTDKDKDKYLDVSDLTTYYTSKQLAEKIYDAVNHPKLYRESYCSDNQNEIEWSGE